MTTSTTPTLRDLRAASPRLTIPEAGAYWRLPRATAYAMAQRGEFPVEVRQIGQRFYVLTADVARALGLNLRDLLAEV